MADELLTDHRMGWDGVHLGCGGGRIRRINDGPTGKCDQCGTRVSLPLRPETLADGPPCKFCGNVGRVRYENAVRCIGCGKDAPPGLPAEPQWSPIPDGMTAIAACPDCFEPLADCSCVDKPDRLEELKAQAVAAIEAYAEAYHATRLQLLQELRGTQSVGGEDG